jgi:hypothetical protein
LSEVLLLPDLQLTIELAGGGVLVLFLELEEVAAIAVLL